MRVSSPDHRSRVERYTGVRGEQNVARIAAAIEASGGRVLEAPDPSEAPFLFKVTAPDGKVLDLVCYAFTANKYQNKHDKKARPLDENRFQIKYGSEFHRSHKIFIDPDRKRVTLMFGVHDDRGLFIAVDPAMHNPTWFSASVEFKDHQLEAATKEGWYGWERDRVAAGRRQVRLQEDRRTETVIAFRPEHFLTFARFERVASGGDPGERLLLSDEIAERIRAGEDPSDLLQDLPAKATKTAIKAHPLLGQLGLEPDELLGILEGSFRLLVAVRGSVAEHHLGKQLKAIRALSNVRRIDADGKPDFEVDYKKRQYRIECKNVLRRLVGKVPRVDFQKTRASKGNPCSRFYDAKQFEVLAACLHPVSQKWEFRFHPTAALPPHKKCEGRLSPRVEVKDWEENLLRILDDIA